MKKVCIIGASGKLGQYMVQHALDRGYKVIGVCRDSSVSKLDSFRKRITIIPGATNNREVIKHAVAGCDGVLTVLVPCQGGLADLSFLTGLVEADRLTKCLPQELLKLPNPYQSQSDIYHFSLIGPHP